MFPIIMNGGLLEIRGAPFCVGKWMLSKRFDAISTAFGLTKFPPSTIFYDQFHNVHQIINAFNNHDTENYMQSWMSCLNKRMDLWMDKFCPGFMCVLHKSHPLGNEYHFIADGDQGRVIMWKVELVGGKDQPKLANGAWASPCKN